jgi:hypothetical protein
MVGAIFSLEYEDSLLFHRCITADNSGKMGLAATAFIIFFALSYAGGFAAESEILTTGRRRVFCVGGREVF